MNITLHKPIFADRVMAPTSKSAAHRALIAAAFADRRTEVRVTGAGEDIAATLRCLSGLGAQINRRPDGVGSEWLEVTPISNPIHNAVLDCGESGSTLRFMVPVVAALGVKATFIRRGRLPERPMEPLLGEMSAHGVHFTENSDGSLTVEGRLPAGEYTIAANISSQFITGLLLGLSLVSEASVLTLTGEIESAPYIDMTVKALTAFEASPEVTENGRCYHIKGQKKQPLRSPQILHPEGDFSGAAFPLAAGALGNHPVTVMGLSFDSLQGDKAILELLQRFGARIDIAPKNGSATVFPSALQGIEIDARQIPDLVPILAVLASGAIGTTLIRGAARLRLKESDRIATTAAMLRALGGSVTETADGLEIVGAPLRGGVVDGANDHRIVMSAAIASLTCKTDVTILGTGAEAKSYPAFFDLIHSTN